MWYPIRVPQPRPTTQTPPDGDDVTADMPVPSRGPIAQSSARATGALAWVGAAGSRKGINRDRNQDRVYLSEWSAIVADGMGGPLGGADAAQAAIDHVRATLDEYRANRSHERSLADPTTLRSAVAGAHRAVSGLARRTNRRGMGCTLTVAVLDGRSGTAMLAHVGDSRAYLFRPPVLTPLTDDHVTHWVNAEGTHRSGLHRVIGGVGDHAVPDIIEVPVEPGDQLLLCSDGVTKVLSDAALADLLLTARSAAPSTRANRPDGEQLQRQAQAIITSAVELGTTDDSSVALVTICAGPNTTTPATAVRPRNRVPRRPS